MVAYFWTTVPLVYGETVLTLIRAAGLLPAAVSDLLAVAFLMLVLWARWFVARTGLAVKGGDQRRFDAMILADVQGLLRRRRQKHRRRPIQIGRASCRERVFQYV